MELPLLFEERMKPLLQTEYDEFRASYEKNRSYGLRLHPGKVSEERFLQLMKFDLRKVLWAKEGFYYDPETEPGKHLFHEIGAYYIQEPSAMGVVEALDPRPGECILDLCAAPGGKTTQIGCRMKGQGLLVSNEIIPSRAKILSQNVERMGLRNCVVLNESPDALSKRFTGFFDRIVVDAPCSGEGMFRKEEIARTEWSPKQVEICIDRQKEILAQAAKMVRSGGRLVYSTCTFEPGENEEMMAWFLEENPEFEPVVVPVSAHFSHGITKNEDLEASCMRLWPHKIEGEGHFIAVLQKKEDDFAADSEEIEIFLSKKDKKKAKDQKGNKQAGGLGKKEIAACLDYLKGLGIKESALQGRPVAYGDRIFLVPEEMPDLEGLRFERPGLWIAKWNKDRFEPAHSLALALLPEDVDECIRLSQKEAASYLSGEEICPENAGNKQGFVLLVVDGFSIGFGKAVGMRIKNHYPKGLRKQVHYEDQ